MIQAVDRAVRVLGVLQGARSVPLSDIAARLGLAPSTVHGIVKTLQANGMVVQEAGSTRYRLGPVVLRLGNAYLGSLELRSRAFAWSAELAKRTGYAVRAGVPLPGEVMIVHHEPRPDGSRQMSEVGLVVPAHATALGKAVLAFAPGADPGELRSMTGETVTDPALLRAELDDVRRDAVAVEQEEAVLGECGLASPVFDAADAVAGAIGVVVPLADWPVADAVRVAVAETARTISRELGASRWPGPSA
ncbi:IclR family transcriptional regulator [Amycolatopsis saalfeldensis]|uniref:Glycerol operon regulatory protein n=1 Tax=Amycolatopsis saalfeldensis TaxID=394193 RepID=A0A1H8Y731_9PSEU|nr:IclR family transcriptional regulator [Amycolatopsis saalfeldensis]SEP47328.1 DNA-binding transcriptional regulator, IclR family [Amycolatopsis saalfeldensis]